MLEKIGMSVRKIIRKEGFKLEMLSGNNKILLQKMMVLFSIFDDMYMRNNTNSLFKLLH